LLDATSGEPDEVRLPALVMGATARWLTGRLDLAREPLVEVYDRSPTGWVRAQALDMLANVELFAGRFEAAAALWFERLRVKGLPRVQPHSRALAALALGYAGDVDRARELASEARTEAERLGSPSAIGGAYYVIGEIEHVAGSGREQDWLERAVQAAERGGASFTVRTAMGTLASSRARAGDVVAAADLYRRLVEMWLRTGTWTQLWTTLRNAAELLVGYDDAGAVRIWAAAQADPQAAALGDDAAERAARQHAEVVDRLGAEVVSDLEEQARTTPRARVAEEASQALRDLALRNQANQQRPAPSGLR
jgi:hypothetical protein